MYKEYKPLFFSFLLWIISVPLYIYLQMPWWFYLASLVILIAVISIWQKVLGSGIETNGEAVNKKRVNTYALGISAIFAVIIITIGAFLMN